MAAARQCLSCNIDFVGRSNQDYCSPACRQRAHRGRKGETVTVPKGRISNATPAKRRRACSPAPPGHCSETIAILEGLDAELAAAGKRLGRTIGWSKTQQALLNVLADIVDRKFKLQQRFDDCEDDHLALKFAAEIRQLETRQTQLLAQVRPNVAAPKSRTSTKAAAAAGVRWARDA